MLARLVGLASGVAAWRRAYGVALVCWAANRLVDGLDGTLARVHGRQTDCARYLDVLLVFVVYTAVPTGLALSRPTTVTLGACAALVGAFFVEGAAWMCLSAVLEARAARAAAWAGRTTVAMPPGLIAGTETVMCSTGFLALPQHVPELFGLTTARVDGTVEQRVRWAWRHLTPRT